MNLTNITAEFLRKTKACEEGVAWYAARPTVHNAEWPVVCAALEEDGQEAWSRWVRRVVAEYGSAEDRAALRSDADWWAREAVAKFGNAEDRAALRGDPDSLVRAAVAKFGNAEDRAALRNDPDAGVRWAVEYYGRSDPK